MQQSHLVMQTTDSILLQHWLNGNRPIQWSKNNEVNNMHDSHWFGLHIGKIPKSPLSGGKPLLPREHPHRWSSSSPLSLANISTKDMQNGWGSVRADYILHLSVCPRSPQTESDFPDPCWRLRIIRVGGFLVPYLKANSQLVCVCLHYIKMNSLSPSD